MEEYIEYSEEILDAIKNNKPIVAIDITYKYFLEKADIT